LQTQGSAYENALPFSAEYKFKDNHYNRRHHPNDEITQLPFENAYCDGAIKISWGADSALGPASGWPAKP